MKLCTFMFHHPFMISKALFLFQEAELLFFLVWTFSLGYWSKYCKNKRRKGQPHGDYETLQSIWDKTENFPADDNQNNVFSHL